MPQSVLKFPPLMSGPSIFFGLENTLVFVCELAICAGWASHCHTHTHSQYQSMEHFGERPLDVDENLVSRRIQQGGKHVYM